MQTIANRPGDWAYVIGPYKDPVATVAPGETFAVETVDAFENKIDSPKADITKLIKLPYVNPLTGPIYVEGAEKGDTLAVTLGPIEVHRPSRRVQLDGEPVHLTPTEFDLLAQLAAAAPAVLTREQLLVAVWGYRDGSGARTVDSHVRAVRRKLGDAVIRTVHGVGYAIGDI